PAGERWLRPRGAQPAAGGRAAAAGSQRVRHPAPRHPGADQGRGGSAGDATEMSRARATTGAKAPKLSSERIYQVIRRPVVTEKSTLGSEHNQVTFVVPLDASKPEIKAAVEEVFKVKVKAVNTLRHKGK